MPGPPNLKRNATEEAEERKARIEMLIEELRLNTEDLQELGRAAAERARQAQAESRDGLARAREAMRKRRRPDA